MIDGFEKRLPSVLYRHVDFRLVVPDTTSGKPLPQLSGIFQLMANVHVRSHDEEAGCLAMSSRRASRPEPTILAIRCLFRRWSEVIGGYPYPNPPRDSAASFDEDGLPSHHLSIF